MMLKELVSTIEMVNRQVVEIIHGRHSSITAQEAKKSTALLRALLLLTGTQETLRMPVPREWTDMLEQLHGTALQITNTQTKRGSR
jgi:hypothetical protein